jgi:hypothetical protein
MREIIEFRIPEHDAQEHLDASVGVVLGGSVRKVVVATDDPLFQHICNLDRDFRAKNNCFYTSWNLHRRYTKTELNAAEVFNLKIKRTFEPSGEVCGTVYDESTACELCGSGAAQRTDLILDPRNLTRAEKSGLDTAKTIADEIVVSEKFVRFFESGGFTGAEFRPVRQKAKPTVAITGWRQLYSTQYLVSIVPPTKTGVSPSEDDAKGAYRCPRGHTIGLNLISELWVSREDFENRKCDLAFTRQHVGTRRGLLRPTPLLLISPRLWRALEEGGLKGFAVEVAHLREHKGDCAKRLGKGGQ